MDLVQKETDFFALMASLTAVIIVSVDTAVSSYRINSINSNESINIVNSINIMNSIYINTSLTSINSINSNNSNDSITSSDSKASSKIRFSLPRLQRSERGEARVHFITWAAQLSIKACPNT